MRPHEIAIASVFAIVAGGYIGVAWDRYKRRPADDRPRRWVESIRMERLHVIDDEYPARSSAVQQVPPSRREPDHHQPPTP